jgi:MoaA/NifB/PqqE/SkfB family radical SAM enzyme
MKVLAHHGKLVKLKRGIVCSPAQWVIYPSNACNMNCGHCIMKEERAENLAQLSEEVLDKAVFDAKKTGARSVIFSGGGEPLTNGQTMFAAEFAKSIGLATGMNTNGLLMFEDMTAIDFLRVSVDAATPETYQKVHGVDGWDRLNESLSRLKRNELGLAFLITPDNFHEIMRFVAWAKKFDPTFVHIRPAWYADPKMDQRMREISVHIEAVKEQVEATNKNVFFRLDKFDGYWTEPNFSKCLASPIMAVLGADGRFMVCQDVFTRFGGNYAEQDFESIWFGDDHRRVIAEIDVAKCPRCVENTYNEVIEHLDDIRMEVL